MIGSTVFYGCMGGGLALFSNALRKLPLMRRPWEHVLYIGIGTYLGSNADEFRAAQRAKLDAALEKRESIMAARKAKVAARHADVAESS